MITSFKKFNNCAALRCFLIPFVLGCFVLSATAWATCQNGCLLHANTALGENALSRNQRESNTAIGFEALFGNQTGSFNTAVGVSPLP